MPASRARQTLFFYELPTNDERGISHLPVRRPPHAPPAVPGLTSPPGAPPATPPIAPEHRHSRDQLYAIYTSVVVAVLVLGALVVWKFHRVFPPLRTPRLVPKAILSRVGEFSRDAGNWRVDMKRMRHAGGSLYVSPIDAWLAGAALQPSSATVAAGAPSESSSIAAPAAAGAARAIGPASIDLEAAGEPALVAFDRQTRARRGHRRTNSAPKFLRAYMARSDEASRSSEPRGDEAQDGHELAGDGISGDRPSAPRWRMRVRPPSEVVVSSASPF